MNEFTWYGNCAVGLNNVMGSHKSQLMISDEADWKVVHKLRHDSVAIAVGSGTVLNDNPSLLTKSKYVDDPHHPVRIIFDRRGRVSDQFKVFKDQNKAPTIWVTNSNKSFKNIIKISGINIQDMTKKIEKTLMDKFNKSGNIIVEGGPTLFKALLNKHILSYLRIYRAPTCFAGDKILFSTTSEYQFRLQTVNKVGIGHEEIYQPVY